MRNPTHILFISEVHVAMSISRNFIAARPVVLRGIRRQSGFAARGRSQNALKRFWNARAGTLAAVLKGSGQAYQRRRSFMA
jgi:hypothetical protein